MTTQCGHRESFHVPGECIFHCTQKLADDPRDALKDAAFAAVVLCNGLSKADRTIAYNGRDDFDVSEALRTALNSLT